MSGEDRKGGGIQSLMRASDILNTVARRRDGISLAQLSKEVGLHSSTAFHLVRTLVTLGYVRQDPETKLYRVGQLLFSLAATALDETELASVAGHYLDELSLATGETSHLAIRSGTEIVVIARREGTGAFRISERTGVTRPPHATAVGKVLLAAMPERNLDLLLARTPLHAVTQRTITSADVLKAELVRVSQAGIAYDDGEFHEEIRCLAVPVRRFGGELAGALGISAPVWRLSLPALQERAATVRDVAGRLTAALGLEAQDRPDAA